jgi:holo-[acyl-carrier protein] synthase
VILGLGIDVVDIARIRAILEGPRERAERFLGRCFTRHERAFCDGFRDRAYRYAVRFAAKEAASKALCVPKGIGWHDVEVVREAGAPTLELRGMAARAARQRGVERVHLALTHDAGIAAATVILEGGLPGGPA